MMNRKELNTMGIQETYQKAMKFAGEKHKAQLVPGTEANYLLHIANVSMEILTAHIHAPCFDLEFAVQVAILHDCLEDTDTTEVELSSVFGFEVTEAVKALTKSPDIPKQDRMEHSINRILLQRSEVAMVKLADRITNLQPPPTHWSQEKCVRYAEEARLLASRLSGANAYLDSRIQEKIVAYCNMITD
jgi:guanosine-3',5'-bis(diphosphate) 3'-pyrophosphohydrolase